MLRSRPQQRARRPQLPFSMRQELGIPDKKKQRTQVSDRKQRRKEERRDEKGNSNKRQKTTHHYDPEDEIPQFENGHEGASATEDEDFEEKQILKVSRTNIEKSKPLPKHATKRSSPTPSASSRSAESDRIDDDEDEDEDSLSRGSREYSPEVILDASSRTFLDRQADDDAEILALEKKLGKKGTKTAVFDDGFDDLLEDLEDSTNPRKQRREAKDWLADKRLRAGTKMRKDLHERSESDYSDAENGFSGFDEQDEKLSGSMIEGEDDLEDQDLGVDEEDDYDTDEERNSITTKPMLSRAPRENPYVAPVAPSLSARYIPPSKREAPQGNDEQLQKLRRQAQGCLNKLSEANIISIVDETSKLYQTNPRQEVTNVIIDLVLTAFTIPTTLNNTFIILHAAFISALYKLHGADFGAEMVGRLVENFDNLHQEPGKASLNLTSLLANLFTFNMVSSTLIYDQIRLLLTHFGSNTSSSEDSAEHLLRIVRDCGPQLRSDDPTALKGIVAMMNETAAKMTTDGSKINIRTRVMMDTITDLKNNKVRHNTNAAGVTGEHLTRMRKALGTLSSRQLRGTEPLGLSRADILNSDKKGKWWLVGASWKGHSQPGSDWNQPNKQGDTTSIIEVPTDTNDQLDTSTTIDIRSLAATHNLTTPLRLSIFTAIMTAHSPPDALHRLTKLRLTRRQEPEVARVLLTLCRVEPNFNPYYAALARQLLRERKYKMPFNIALWKFFAELGEQVDADNEDEDDRSENIQVSEIANTARLYARLVAKISLHLDILKTLNIGILGEKASLWLEVFFIALLAQNKLDDEAIVRIFGACEGRLRKSISWFLRKNVRRSNLLTDKDEKRKVKKGCKLVEATFAAVEGKGEDELGVDD